MGLGRGYGSIDCYKELSEASKSNARERLKGVKVIIIDEMSLGSNKQDDVLNNYMNDVFEVPVSKKGEILYNNISVIQVGDFMQLNLRGSPIFVNTSTAADHYSTLRPNRWKANFKCFELIKSMRQKENNFARILKTVKYMNISKREDLNNLTAEEAEAIAFLRSRDIQPIHPSYPHTALHIFPTNADVNKHNALMIKTLPNVIHIETQDSVMDQTGSFHVTEVRNPINDEGLAAVLEVAVGAKVMVTRNQDVSDGIVNGMLGIIVGFSNFENRQIAIIWVQPEDKKAGTIKRSQLKKELQSQFPGSIPIKRVEANIEVANNNSTFKRRQFPLKLCYAATIHKYQGRSLDVLVMGGFDGKGWKGNGISSLTLKMIVCFD